MRTSRLLISLGVISSLLLGGSGLIHAEGFTASGKSIEQRLAELEKEVQRLKRLKEVDQEIQIKRDSETPIVVAGKEGFSLKSRDSAFILRLRGQVQADGRFFIDDNTSSGSNTYLLRRVRPTFEGTLFKYFDFRLMPDFGGGSVSLQDAYIDFKYWPKASLRVGKFKSPLGLERRQTDANKLFVEDSLASNLVPNRDVGIDLHGELFDGVLNYDAGYFNGVADGTSADTDNHDDKEFVGRIFMEPFKNSSEDWLSGLGVGIAGSAGASHGSSTALNLPTFRSGGQQTIFSYSSTTLSDGGRFRIAPQAYYYNGPLGFMGEGVVSSQRFKSGPFATRLTHWAWQIAGSYVLTGENVSYNGIVPRNNFDIDKKTWGAFELASRLSWLNLDHDAFPRYASSASAVERAIAWTVGLNWYLNKNLKFMTDFESTFFDGGAAAGGNRKNENAILARFQLGF